MESKKQFTRQLCHVSNADVGSVGGKNASLGEMIQHLQSEGIRVPGGFATTAAAYWHFIDSRGLRERIQKNLMQLANDEATLDKTGKAIRHLINNTEFPHDLSDAIRSAYQALRKNGTKKDPAVAVRSSATAEDLPDASFAGQQETYLNIRGEAALLDACRRCFASLFTDRAIAYRQNHGFEHMQVALSIGVQLMVDAGNGAAGVMFSIDTETGFRHAVLINANWGLGETVVQGNVDPDEYIVFKPLLKDKTLQPIIEKKIGNKDKKLVYSNHSENPTRMKKNRCRKTPISCT